VCIGVSLRVRDRHSVTVQYVKSLGSSLGGCVASPLSTAAISGPMLGVSLSPASPLPSTCPRRPGELPSSDPPAPPALSLLGSGLEALGGPSSGVRVRKDNFPPLVYPVADEEWVTIVVADCAEFFVPDCVLPSDVARGLAGGPLSLAWDRVSIPADT